jgi:hypothetical protein
MNFQSITPAQGADGKYYIDKNGGDNFSAYHLDYERERGNLIEVEYIREIQSEDEINENDLICYGSMITTKWRLA